MPFFFVVFLSSIESFAFLDFVGEQAKKAIEVATYVDAASELISEISPDESLENGAREIQKRAEDLRRNSSELKYISRSTQNILKGPDWSSKRLDRNIQSTTDYVRRLKSLLLRATALGTEGTIALNTTETNVALAEIQRNQQALIIQNSENQLRELEKEHEEAHSWSMFSDKQRKLRNQGMTNAKLQ